MDIILMLIMEIVKYSLEILIVRFMIVLIVMFVNYVFLGIILILVLINVHK